MQRIGSEHGRSKAEGIKPRIRNDGEMSKTKGRGTEDKERQTEGEEGAAMDEKRRRRGRRRRR